MRTALSTQICQAWDAPQSLRIAADLGYDGIELLLWEPHTSPEKLRPILSEVKSLAMALGVEIPVVTVTRPVTELADDLDYWRAVLAVASELGAGVVKTPSAPPASAQANDQHFQQAGLAARECAAHAAHRGLRLACETHLGMISDTITGTLRFLAVAASDDLYLTLDVCNAYTSGDDPVEAVAHLVERTTLVHVKDGRRLGGGECTWHPLGHGEVNFAGVVAQLAVQGYSGWASIECLSCFDGYMHIRELGTTDPVRLARHDLLVWRSLANPAGRREQG